MTQTHSAEIIDLIQPALLEDPEFLRGLLQSMLQKLVNGQFAQHMGAEKYERNETRSGYRNGSYQRGLTTRVGRLELQICRDREGSFQPQIFERYQRSEKALFLGIAEMYFQGVSTRKVTAVFEELCGVSISKSQVSVLSKELDEKLNAWRRRPLDQPYRYIIVDARVQKVREDGRVISTASLIAVGVTEEGYREVIGCQVADSESEETWAEFFKDLQTRGLHGVRLIVSDDHRGLTKALDKHFQGVPWQRCQVHFMRNLLTHLGRSHAGSYMELLQDVFAARTKEEAEERGKVLAEKLRAGKKEKIATWIEENLEDCLGVYTVPEKHRVKLRTTNMVERLNEEIKRRCQVIRVFPNRDSALRIVSANCMEASDKWIDRKYLTMEERETVA
jgi:transposase-like protein